VSPERGISDPLHLRSESEYVEFRLRTVGTAAWPTVFVATYCLLYYAITWDEAHRSALIGLSLGTIVDRRCCRACRSTAWSRRGGASRSSSGGPLRS